MKLLGYKIDRSYPDFPIKNKKIINTLNPHSYCVAKKDPSFRCALQASDLLIPDGTGIVLAAQFLRGKKIDRIAGADMHLHLLRQAQKYGLKVFYMGSSWETLSKIETRIQEEYPAICYKGYSPPYKAAFSKKDNSKMQEAINTFQPEILFVGMTAPKQEKWVHKNKEYLNVQVICSIGAVFDFYAGTAKRAPAWMQNTGLEWLHRSIVSPTRLGKRNMRSNPEFVWDVIKAKVKEI